jgi:hypothetical protein
MIVATHKGSLRVSSPVHFIHTLTDRSWIANLSSAISR